MSGHETTTGMCGRVEGLWRWLLAGAHSLLTAALPSHRLGLLCWLGKPNVQAALTVAALV
jgi:hypothetical protein